MPVNARTTTAGVVKYTKTGSDAEYIAAQVGGPWDDFPSWFGVAERAGLLRYTAEGGLEVKIITGQRWSADVGDWVVLQKGFGCYLIGDDDFRRMFHEARG